MATSVIDAWVSRVLGLDLARASAEGGQKGTLSLMRLGKARVEWIGGRRAAVGEIARLRVVIEAMFKSDQDQAAALAAALAELGRRMDALDPTLEEQLDTVLNAAPAARGKAIDTARVTLSKFIAYLDTDELMVELDGNEVIPDMAIVAPMRAVLSDIAAALG